MNKNKIAGLVLAGAIISGAGTTGATALAKTPVKTKNSTKNEILLSSDHTTEMDTTAVVINGDNSLVLKNSPNGSIISYLSVGEMLHITAKEGNYYKVTVEETGTTGYISAKNIQTIVNGTTNKFVKLNEEGHVVNVSTEVHLRGKATLDSNIIGFLKNGDNFKILGKEGQWYKIDANGHIGFIYEEYVVKSTINTAENTTINENPVVKSAKVETVSNLNITNTTSNINSSNSNKVATNNITATTVAKTEATTENNNNSSSVTTKPVETNNKETNNTGNTNSTIKNTKEEVSSTAKNTKKTENAETTSNVKAKTPTTQNNYGNATITFINSKTSKPLVNQAINVDGKVLYTNSKGEINFIKLTAGQTKLTISAEGFNNTTAMVNIEAGKTVEGNVKLTSSEGTALLTFVNANHSRALANLNININGTVYTTNGNGEILLKDLTVGNENLTISAKGFNNTTAMVNIVSNGQSTGTINLYPKATVATSFIAIPTENNANTSNNSKAASNDNSNSNAKVANNTNSNSNAKAASNTNSNSNAKVASNTNSNSNAKVASNTNSNSNAKVASNTNSNSNAKVASNTNSNSNAKVASNTNSNSNAKVASNTNSNSNAKVASNTNSNSNAKVASNTNSNINAKAASNTNSNNNSNPTATSGQSTTALQQAIVNYAEQYLGCPYVWGATGPNEFDCSGLTSYVYRHFGYNIGRTTYQQVYQGTPVSLNNLQAGDLIFWGPASAPYHVAIYIGNGQYIQAPHTGENVDISSWNLNNVSAARRII